MVDFHPIDNAQLAGEWQANMLGNYTTPRLRITHGVGSYVFADDGRKYLDLLGGIAVSALGHGHPALVEAVARQAAKLMHTSNLYAHQPGLDLAQKLRHLAQSHGRVMFTQDGATANEAALKLARRFGAASDRSVIVATDGGFHGRTMGALAVTGNPAKRDPFAPFGYDVRFVEFGNSAALEAALRADVAAVIVEPIQGENGVIVPPPGYLQRVAAATKAAGALLIVDEVQSGIGRTGNWFASHAAGVRPDIITLAKGLAGGMPLGAVIVEPALCDVFVPGDHGTTFGGNPVSCAAALAVIDTIERENLLEHVDEVGAWFSERIVRTRHDLLGGIRGAGFWFALELTQPKAQAFETVALEAGYLVNAVRPDAIRLAPPLNTSRAELQTFVDELPAILSRAAL